MYESSRVLHLATFFLLVEFPVPPAFAVSWLRRLPSPCSRSLASPWEERGKSGRRDWFDGLSTAFPSPWGGIADMSRPMSVIEHRCGIKLMA